MASRNQTRSYEATRTRGSVEDVDRGQLSDGEGFPPGTANRAILNERVNKSLNRNAGPEGRPSANTGTIPLVTLDRRNTGRIV